MVVTQCRKLARAIPGELDECNILKDIEELRMLIRRLYEETDEQLRNKFQRSLSFEDGLFDRWERARRLGFEEGASIYNSALVYGDIAVGHNTWVGPGTLLDGSGGQLSIGSFCSVAAGVQIYTHDTAMWALSGGVLGQHCAPVTIGDCTYIGSQSIVTAGITIGNHVVIGANSFVNKNILSRTIVAGSPARKIGHVEGSGDNVRIVYDKDSQE